MQMQHLEADKQLAASQRKMGTGMHGQQVSWHGRQALSLSEDEHPVAPSQRPSPMGVVGSVRPLVSHHRRSTSALSLSLGLMLTLLRDSVDRDTPASVLCAHMLQHCSVMLPLLAALLIQWKGASTV